MTSTIEWTIPSGSEASSTKMVVRRDDDQVTVTWLCGETRRFTLDDLRAAIENLQTVAVFSDVWLKAKDSMAGSFYCRLIDDNFYADARPEGRSGFVRWGGENGLHAALTEALRKPRKAKKLADARKS